jgi:hypothetical protein
MDGSIVLGESPPIWKFGKPIQWFRGRGYVTNLQLAPGAIVSAGASAVPFVCDRDHKPPNRTLVDWALSPQCRICFQMTRGRILADRDVSDEHQFLLATYLPCRRREPGASAGGWSGWLPEQTFQKYLRAALNAGKRWKATQQGAARPVSRSGQSAAGQFETKSDALLRRVCWSLAPS